MTSPGAGSGSIDPSPLSDPPLRADAPTSHLPGQILSGNWPAQAADAVIKTVDVVRDKTTGPIQTAARGLVYGIMAVVIGTMVLVLVIVAMIRFLDAIQPFGNIWFPYLELGIAFSVGGYLVFRRRRRVEF